MRARARLGNRGAVPRAGGRRPGPGPHTGGTHTQHTYVQAHVSGSLRAGTRRQGHGRHRRTYCQGGDSDWAALRALRAVETRPGSWAKIASPHESGISFGRYLDVSWCILMYMNGTHHDIKILLHRKIHQLGPLRDNRAFKIHLGYIRIQQDTLILQDTLTIHAIYIRIRIR